MTNTDHLSLTYLTLFASVAFCLLCAGSDNSFGQGLNVADGKKFFADNHIEFIGQPGNSTKSEAAAIFYSALSTIAPAGIGYAVGGDLGISLFAAGISIGPSVGILYAGDIDRAAQGLGVRAAGGAVAGIGAIFYIFDTLGGRNRFSAGRTMIYGGLTLTGTSALYDILVASPRAVQKHNRQNEPSLNPWADPFTGSIGLSLNLNF